MIYIIDDKKLRQSKDYKWTIDKFNKYKDQIITIYNLEEYNNRLDEIYREGNVVCYHTSFKDISDSSNQILEIPLRLKDYNIENDNFKLILFSGGVYYRNFHDNYAEIPVSLFYSNLEIFVHNFTLGTIDLKYIVFGNNEILIEDKLNNLQLASVKYSITEPKYNTIKKNLYFRTSDYYIKDPLENLDQVILYDDVSEIYFDDIVNQYFKKEVYNAIFIPLCFGNTLSDFNGLRLACHVRCTLTLNQITNIYIYGFVGIEYLLQNSYFDILKTKNVFLISFSKKAIYDASESITSSFLFDDLPQEISKLNLDIPKDYLSNHSIANEWGVYQMARNANININEIKEMDDNSLKSLYFKWLLTKYKLRENLSEDQKEFQIKYSEKLPGLKVVGKINL